MYAKSFALHFKFLHNAASPLIQKSALEARQMLTCESSSVYMPKMNIGTKDRWLKLGLGISLLLAW